MTNSTAAAGNSNLVLDSLAIIKRVMKKMNLVSRFKNVGVLGFVLAFVVVSIQAQGQARFATVDMKKIFDSYYKTKQAEAQIKDRAAESDKVYKGMVEDYKQLNEDYKKLIDGSNDQALSSDEREKRKKSAENKL